MRLHLDKLPKHESVSTLLHVTYLAVQCYPGRHVYNDGKTGWCDAIEADEQHREDGSREGGSQDDDNQRQRRSASHEGSDDDVHHQSHGDPDDDTDSSRERPHQGPSGPHGSHEATGPHRRHGPRKTKGHAPDSREGLNSGSDLLKTTTAPGRLGRQGQPAPCTLVTAEVNSRHGDTWKATLYSSRKSADKCSEVMVHDTFSNNNINNKFSKQLFITTYRALSRSYSPHTYYVIFLLCTS